MKDESPSYELPAEATDSKEAFLQILWMKEQGSYALKAGDV